MQFCVLHARVYAYGSCTSHHLILPFHGMPTDVQACGTAHEYLSLTHTCKIGPLASCHA